PRSTFFPYTTPFRSLYYEELIVLPEKEYQPLSELLHRFPSGLTSQIAEAMPSNLRRLSEIFLNIFQVSGKAADWLMALVEDEIEDRKSTRLNSSHVK